MKKFLLLQLGNRFIFGENRFVCLAGGPGDDAKKGTAHGGGEEKKEAPKPAVEKPAEGAETEVDKTVTDIKQKVETFLPYIAERYRESLDRFGVEIPADVDPNEVKNARTFIETEISMLGEYNSQLESNINGLISNTLKEDGDKQTLFNKIWVIAHSMVPEFSNDDLRSSKPELGLLANTEYLRRKLNIRLEALFKKTSKEKINRKAIKEFTEKSASLFPKIAEHEFNMLKRLNMVQEVLWDLHDQLKRKQIEKRMLATAERNLGFALVPGQKLMGRDVSLIYNEESATDKYSEKKVARNKRWQVLEAYVNKEIVKDPKTKKKKILMKETLIAIQDMSSGTTVYMPMQNMVDFVNQHDIVPVVNSQKELPKVVPYLREIFPREVEDREKIFKPGTEIEFDVLGEIDEKTHKPKVIPAQVKIVDIDDKFVTFSEPVLFMARWNSPDKSAHVYKDKMSLGEFAKWLHIRHALPVMDIEALKEKLIQHKQHLDIKYNRAKSCHRAIRLEVGEILYVEAPGNPMFEILEMGPGTISVRVGKSSVKFTYPQFLRWIYENDIEPFDPALQAARAKTYLKKSDKEAAKIEEDARKIPDYVRKTGEYRNTLEKMHEQGMKTPKEKKIHVEKMIPIDAHQHGYSAFSEFLRDTRILRLDDIFKIFKSYWDFYKHNFERAQKDRYSAIGKGLPFYGTDFARINQEAEDEEVAHEKKAIEQWGIWQIEDTMYHAHNKDQLKACIDVLASKGKFRWDDTRIWALINHFNRHTHQIPVPPPDGDPNSPYAEGTGMKFAFHDIAGKTGMDLLPEAIDALWGEGTYIGWKRNNDSGLEDGATKAYPKAKELENDPKGTGGISNEISVLLERHMNDEFVDPSEFEGLLRYLFEAGKGSGEDKVYFILMGVTAENGRGRTILSWDRIGILASKFTAIFPVFEYFTDGSLRRHPQTHGLIERPWRKKDFEYLTNEWIQNARHDKFRPPATVKKFLWDEILTSEKFQERLEKGIRNAQNMDHDDTPFFIPALKENDIENICANAGGEVKKLSTQGYKNVYVGFAPRLKALFAKYAHENEMKAKGQPSLEGQYLMKLTGTFRAFMRFDSILNRRFNRTQGEKFARFTDQDLATGCVWDVNTPIAKYQDNMTELIKRIITAYGQEKREELYTLPFIRLPSIKDNDALKKQQDKIEASIDNFGVEFDKMIKSDNGKKMINIVKDYQFLEAPKGTQDKLDNKLKMFMQEAEAIGAVAEE